MKLLKKFYQILESRRRRREVRKIRREFASAGYPLDQFRDSQIEAALHRNTEVGFTINAKTIYRTLKRLNVTRGEQDHTLDKRGAKNALRVIAAVAARAACSVESSACAMKVSEYVSSRNTTTSRC